MSDPAKVHKCKKVTIIWPGGSHHNYLGGLRGRVGWHREFASRCPSSLSRSFQPSVLSVHRGPCLSAVGPARQTANLNFIDPAVYSSSRGGSMQACAYVMQTSAFFANAKPIFNKTLYKTVQIQHAVIQSYANLCKYNPHLFKSAQINTDQDNSIYVASQRRKRCLSSFLRLHKLCSGRFQ